MSWGWGRWQREREADSPLRREAASGLNDLRIMTGVKGGHFTYSHTGAPVKSFLVTED